MKKHDRFQIFLHGDECVEVEDNGFSVMVDPNDNVPCECHPRIILLTKKDDNWSSEIVKRISDSRTCVVLTDEFSESDAEVEDVELVSEGETIDIYGVEIRCIGNPDGSLGYCFTMEDTSFYVSGNASLESDVWSLERIADVAFLRVSNNCRGFDLDEVVKAAVRIKPDKVIPYGYKDEENFNLKGLKTELLDRNIDFETV